MQEKLIFRCFDKVPSATLHAEQRRADWRAEPGRAKLSEMGWGRGSGSSSPGMGRTGKGGDKHLRQPTLSSGAKGPCREPHILRLCSGLPLATYGPKAPQPNTDSTGPRRCAHTEPTPPSCAAPACPGSRDAHPAHCTSVRASSPGPSPKSSPHCLCEHSKRSCWDRAEGTVGTWT